MAAPDAPLQLQAREGGGRGGDGSHLSFPLQRRKRVVTLVSLVQGGRGVTRRRVKKYNVMTANTIFVRRRNRPIQFTQNRWSKLIHKNT